MSNNGSNQPINQQADSVVRLTFAPLLQQVHAEPVEHWGRHVVVVLLQRVRGLLHRGVVEDTPEHEEK